ncbi:MAG: CsbD family protein [Acidimicrobiales bacterium]
MSSKDKIKDKSQQLKGKVKEVAGRGMGNESLEREGKLEQTKGNLKQAGEKVKDAIRP